MAKCVEKATKKVGIACEQSLRPDSDTKGETGTPDIPKVILEKISSAAIFVGDVTLIGKATMERSFLARLFRRFSNRQKNLDNPKMLPNPNVLLELGYAAHCLGWERVILVMNSHFGPPEFLPFDLRHRRFPISYHLRTVPYHLSPKSEGKSSVRSKLVGDLATSIEEVLAKDHLMAERVLRKMDRDCLGFLRFVRNHEFFSDDNGHYTPLIRRLLELSVIFTDHNPETNKYAYHWTYIGSLARNKA